MADNVTANPGTGGATFATDEIAGVHFPRSKIVFGTDGAASDVSDSTPLPITAPSALSVTGPLTDSQLRATAINVTSVAGVSTVEMDPSTATSFGPVTTASTVLFAAVDTANERVVVLQLSGLWDGGIKLQASQDASTWFDVQGVAQSSDVQSIDTIYAPDVIMVPVMARWFRAITTGDFSGSVAGSYTLRVLDVPPYFQQSTLVGVDPSVSMPVAGTDPAGMTKRLSLTETGQIIPADGRVITGERRSAGTIWMVDMTGFASIAVQMQGTFSGTITFQASNDLTTWTAVAGWPVGGAAAPVQTAAGQGQWMFPAVSRYFRAQITTYTSGQFIAIGVLKITPCFFPVSSPNIAANSTVNMAQVGGTNTVTANVAGMAAVGGNIAVGSAPTAHPIPLAWDGTNTRRLLTDAVSGGIVLGANAASNNATLSTVVAAASNNLTQLKGSAGRLYSINALNTTATIQYIKIFNLPSASVTMGTTNATWNIGIPASGSVTLVSDMGFNTAGTGITYAITTGSALNDNTSTTAGSVVANFMWI